MAGYGGECLSSPLALLLCNLLWIRRYTSYNDGYLCPRSAIPAINNVNSVIFVAPSANFVVNVD